MAPQLVDSVRRWAAALRDTDAGSPEAESVIHGISVEIDAGRERSRRDADDRFAAFYHHCPVAVVLVGTAGLVAAVNPAFLELADVDERDVTGTHAEALGAGDRDRAVLRNTLTQVTPERRVQEQVRINAAGNQARPVRLTAAALPGTDATYPILMFEDLYELNQLRETFQYQGLHDPLTGLPNGTHLRSRLEAMLSGGVREHVALLYLDIDGFKVVNDGFGAEVADQVLRGVAATLRGVFADGFVARLFGDEFAVALRGDLSPASVVELAEQTLAELADPQYVDDVGIGVSASIGIVVTDVPGPDHDEVMHSADVALHRAKDLGKAQWVLFDPQVGGADRDRYRLACAIAGALETGEMTVRYHPHVVLPDARIVTSVNAALCWEHPTLGTLRAEEFYPLAETTGMTVPLGRYLLAEALATSADWRARFGTDAPMVCLTLPRRMAIDGDLVGMVRAELDRNGLDPRHVMLCADAQSLLDPRGDLIDSIGHLARLGVLFVLNVTGLPELELVPAHQVPAPAVMLTGQLVRDLGVDRPPRWAGRNVRQLVERAEELGVKVGAHGVRSEEHARLLFDLGVVVAAGPYLPEHLTREEAEIWVGRAFSAD
ncbi:diguanylate cyclase domain-containing protein [Actinophytocola oryzae]|uniref:PAS domain S-box-containing protein/diguanylate cyclase (GGDEF)-like protein n=1 Tax=Actinophytocola oryzae TaxID=502181 RepID=A0A4R7W4J0_9PSEU|nr:diguanylate cyclase [Actinophytocola oryzae]TDV57640.1 PAS domain S-box-containing protein/diguanylate cyclase (GGDEF)-like protein [Actinophytocola oryzae]